MILGIERVGKACRQERTGTTVGIRLEPFQHTATHVARGNESEKSDMWLGVRSPASGDGKVRIWGICEVKLRSCPPGEDDDERLFQAQGSEGPDTRFDSLDSRRVSCPPRLC
jgi:hypothetical protein